MSQKHVVAVYDVARLFGGREEGGWWYNAGSLVRVVRILPNEDRANAFCRRLNRRLDATLNAGKRELSSVLSDGRYIACVFPDTAPAGFPEQTPRYE